MEGTAQLGERPQLAEGMGVQHPHAQWDEVWCPHGNRY